MTRRINQKSLDTLKQWEGWRAEAYRDVGGIWTIGYGSTGSHVYPGQRITPAQGEQLLKEDLDRFEKAVERLVKVPLNDNQFGALVLFAFNVGEGAFEKSTLLRNLNAGNYASVPAQLARWNKVKGKVIKGLTNRRNAEITLWNTPAGITPAPVPTPVPAKRSLVEIILDLILRIFRK